MVAATIRKIHVPNQLAAVFEVSGSPDENFPYTFTPPISPFADKRLILSETERLGSTQYDILKENDDLILRAERAHTVIKKYGTVEPKSEVTIGQADAIPVFDTVYRNLYVKTDGTEWD